jgi:hypothetical protein
MMEYTVAYNEKTKAYAVYRRGRKLRVFKTEAEAWDWIRRVSGK